MRRIVLLVSSLIAGLPGLSGDAVAQGGAVLVLETNEPKAMVFADSLWLGPASRAVFTLPPGVRVLRLVPPAVDAWTIEPRQVDLAALPPGDTLRLHLPFPYHYRVESIPFGAPVYLATDSGRVRLGETPLTYRSPAPLQGDLVIDLPGFERERRPAGTALWNRHVVALTPVAAAAAAFPGAEVDWQPPGKHRAWIDYAAVGTALAAGALAVHFKMKADRRFDHYQRTGDPRLRPAIERYDLYSGIALGVSQISLGFFAIRLLLR
ncbi:hypothetical protein GQ464_003815 [Rhodocaloribacter litoris]|uniref:hypothetical protein n=1 Tax=Rhodocaloribacter litoris TaxID=2558931 RepID=UPI0014219A95|nr:hypothetical protein [Rhodocaloribacter litoris]QXD16085.1 hypothetical protein GQ464_003815 [Rhodocaloribacter litoris]